MGELYRIGSLVVNMRFKDNKQHHKPHVHAKCGNDEAVVGVDGELLAVSQFTLTASTKKGNRPSYIRAAGHGLAIPLYEKYCQRLSEAAGRPVQKGVFGADMKCSLVNDGPVTIIIDSRIRE